MDMSNIRLTDNSVRILTKTISDKAIFYIIIDHIVRNIPMSIVRMGDGEQIILYKYFNEDSELYISDIFDNEWTTRMGYVNAKVKDAYKYIIEAEETCTYFAPNLAGTIYPSFNLYKYFKERDFYVDNFFVNVISHENIDAIYKVAKKILIIHAEPKLGNIATTKLNNDNYSFEYLQLTNWDQVDDVVKKAGESDNKLILISGSKVIGPRLANKYSKICIDIGNTMDHWLFS